MTTAVDPGVSFGIAPLIAWYGVSPASVSGTVRTGSRSPSGTRCRASSTIMNSAIAPGEPPAEAAVADRESFAVMHIPRLGAFQRVVGEGTSRAVLDSLDQGLAHYSGSAQPGALGNFAVAGHRRTYGDPFKDFPKLRPGDAVVVNDGTTWFTYRIAKKPHRTVPTDTAVVDPVPRSSGFEGAGRYLTLTTCEPEWGSSHRLIAWAHLDATRPVSEGEPPELAD